ncbi:MAG: nucleotidyltransferase family protein [Nitrososphaerales archaeon]|nr:nucleotidyltransferase family protein [Nitrososphaerales archaeon]
MKAVVLSGGQGLRLRPLTEDMPKMMVNVSGRPIAEHQLDWLIGTGALDCLVFACGYKWERIKEHFGSSYKGVKVEYSVEEETLGTGGAIKKAMSQYGTDEEFIALNGDVITDLPLKRLAEAHRSNGDIAATMLVVPYKSRFGVVRIDKLKVVRGFEEKPAFPDVWINGGVYYLNARKCLKYLPDVGDIERESFPKMVSHGELMSYPYYGEWYFIDSVKDIKEVEVSLQTT